LINYEKYTELLQWHLGVELFDYNPTIDWAIHMMGKGIETDNMLILASFSKPVDREEIKPYVSGVLKDLELDEKIGEYSIVSNCYYHVQQIIDEYDKRKNLSFLYSIHLENNYPEYTSPFYLLYHGWSDLETEGYNYYYDGATLNNIETVVNLESQKFISKYIDKNELKTREIEEKLTEITNQKENKSTFWSKLITKLKGGNAM